MALKVADRVKQLTNTTGSGTITLASTPAGFQSFGSVLSDSDTTYYVLVENDDFEIGVGTYSSNTLARTSILQSSNSDNIIPLGGSGTVFIGYPADKSVYQNEESQVVVGASGLIFNNSTIIKDGKITELTDVDSSGTPTSTHLMSFNITNYGLTIGNQTGWSNGNTLIGHHAGSGLTTGSDSTMVGYQAGNRNQAGNNNTFIGHQAGPTHPGVGTTIYNSTALGYQAGNKMGVNSTAIGYQSALSTNNTGFVSVGVSTGSGLGADAVAVGRSAGHDLNEQYAIAVGYQAGYEGGGTSSAWLGHAAGHSSNGATRSIGLGYQAGKSTTGDDCIYLGNSAGQSNTSDDYFYVANAAPSSNGTLIKGDMTNKRVAVGKADITLDSTLHVGINTATHVGLIVKSASAQSADLTQWQNVAGSSVAAMAKSGVLTVNGLYASGAGLQIADTTPAVTANAIYSAGGTLYFNGSVIAVEAPTMTQFNYASGAAVYASGQALSLTYASGLTATNASNITTVTSTANYASGQSLSLAYASGLTPNIATNTSIANYASGVVTGGNMYVGEYIYHNGDADTYIRLRGDQFDFVAGGRTMLTLDEASNDKVTVNDSKNDVDFQVKGDNDADLIRTDAANDLVGIGTSSPSYKLDVVGYDALVQSSGLIVGNSGIVLANNTPGVTTNTLYNDAGTLSWNGSAVGGGGASATATYASGQALSLTYASGLTATNASNIVAVSGIANYASGQALSLTHASGLTATNATNITSATNIANYASGQSLSLGHASGVATSLLTASGTATSLIASSGTTTALINSSGVATYASGQALSLTYASGLTVTNSAIANYASGQSLSLTHASGLTATNAGNITTVTATANYASGQALSLTTASGVANYASGQALSLSHASGVATSLLTASGTATSLIASSGTTTALINSSGVATYASGQALSLANASGIAAYASGQVNATAGTATASKALILDSNKSFTGIADGSFQKIGVGTTSPQYGLQLVGAGTSGVIQSSGILIGPSGIGVGTTTPVHPIDVVQHSGVVRASGMHSAISMNADAATVTFDLDQATTHGVTLGNNRTLALSNVQIGDKFLIRLQQDGTGSRTVTWFNHISWAGGSAPTLTTTAHKADIIGFLTASGTGGAYWFDGLVVGQNI